MNIDSTLTQGERSPFALPNPYTEPLPRLTRLPMQIDGNIWFEIHPETGCAIASGELPVVEKEPSN